MSMNEVDVKGVRYRLMQYTSLVNDVVKWEDEIEVLNAKINKIASGSPKLLPEGNVEDVDWRSPLFEEIDKLEALIKVNNAFIEMVHEFVKQLEPEDKQLIDKLYLRTEKKTYTEICEEYKYSRTGLHYKVETLIKYNWKY